MDITFVSSWCQNGKKYLQFLADLLNSTWLLRDTENRTPESFQDKK